MPSIIQRRAGWGNRAFHHWREYSTAMRKEFSSQFGGGFGFGLGICLAIVAVAGGLYAYFYLAEPITTPAVARTIGTPQQAKNVALGAMRKHGVAELAKEARAVFDHVGQRWAVSGHAKTDGGKLVEATALVNVGTVDGALHWRVTFLEIDGKAYLAK